MEYTILVILVLVVFYLLTTLSKLDNRVQNLKYTLDQIAKKMELPEAPINDELREFLKEGKDVYAVKVARENLGLSLVEGKQYIDALKIEDS